MGGWVVDLLFEGGVVFGAELEVGDTQVVDHCLDGLDVVAWSSTEGEDAEVGVVFEDLAEDVDIGKPPC